MSLRSSIVCLAFLASAVGCSSSGTQEVHPDSSTVTPDTGADSSIVSDGAAASSDSPTNVPEARVRVVFPPHLYSDVQQGAEIKFSVTFSTSIDKLQALQRLKDATEIVDRQTKTPVAGTWSYKNSTAPNPLDATFSPGLLAKGDYLVKIKETPGKLEPRRAVTMFHVGSMPRVMAIRFFYSKKVQGKPLEFDVLLVQISEQVDYSKVTATFENEVAGVWTKLGATQASGGWNLSAPLDVTRKLRVTVGQEVGAASGLKLDGLYTGIPGSGDFTATILPEAYTKHPSGPQPYVPAVSY